MARKKNLVLVFKWSLYFSLSRTICRNYSIIFNIHEEWPQLFFWRVIFLFHDGLNIMLAAEVFQVHLQRPDGLPLLCMGVGLGSQHVITLSWEQSTRCFPGFVCIPYTLHALLLPNVHKTIPYSFCIANVRLFFRLILWPWEKLVHKGELKDVRLHKGQH